MAPRPRWFDRSALHRPAPACLLGVLELPPAAGVALELHLTRPSPGSPSWGVWFDERGRRWALVESALA